MHEKGIRGAARYGSVVWKRGAYNRTYAVGEERCGASSGSVRW